MEAQTAQHAPLFSREALRRLLIPLLLEQFLSVSMGMADTIMVAGVGEAAVSSISLVDSINAELGETHLDVWPPGTKVHHRAFGTGEIVRFDPQAQSYRVRFASSERDLVPRVLTKVDP